MANTRKVQVTLNEDIYERLAAIARRQERKLAAVVRESIVRYCIEPDVQRRKQDALDKLLALDPAPVPVDYADWEAEYMERRGRADAGEAGAGEADDIDKKRRRRDSRPAHGRSRRKGRRAR
jgi:predicted DNA-binding protein